MKAIIVEIVLTVIVFFGIIFYVSTSYQPQKQAQSVMANQVNQTMASVKSSIQDTDPTTINITTAQTQKDTFYTNPTITISVGTQSNRTIKIDADANPNTYKIGINGTTANLTAVSSITTLKALLTTNFYTQVIYKDINGNTLLVKLDPIL